MLSDGWASKRSVVQATEPSENATVVLLTIISSADWVPRFVMILFFAWGRELASVSSPVAPLVMMSCRSPPWSLPPTSANNSRIS